MTFIVYLLLICAVGYFAKSRGRSPIGWVLIAILISPLLASIILLFLKNLNTYEYKRTPRDVKRGNTIPQDAEIVENDLDDFIHRMENKLSLGKTNSADVITITNSDQNSKSVDQKEVAQEEKNSPTQAYCESCGQPLPINAKFCTNCGASIGK